MSAIRILFIEDDAMNRRVVREMVEFYGMNFTEAENAQAGLELIDQAPFDLVLTDLRMKGMDGLTAVKRIRARPDVKARIPIVIITGAASDDVLATCLESGANAVLLKPIIMDTLASRRAPTRRGPRRLFHGKPEASYNTGALRISARRRTTSNR